MTVIDDTPPWDPSDEPPEEDYFYDDASRDWYIPIERVNNPAADIPWPGQNTPEEQEASDIEHARSWDPKVELPPIVSRVDELQARRRADLAATRADLEADGKVMRHYTASELVALPRRFEWVARGWLTRPTYGMIAGEKKTLKTYVSMFMHLALVSGQPIFGRFDVDQAVPVVSYVGEGGRIPYANRLERVARALEVDLDNVPLMTTFEAPPISSEKFQLTLRHDLEEFRPGLVSVDPLYAFHGTGTDARNLHDEGSLLTSMSSPCSEAGACLQVVNHFNKTGNGKGLDRITMSGAAEWVDSWTLLTHRAPPDVENGAFKLLLEIGSRQWGGTSWDLDLTIGRFNPDTGEHDGDITWDLRHHDQTDSGDGTRAGGDQVDAILDVVADEPLEYTKTEVLKHVGGNAERARRAWDELVDNGRIVGENVPTTDTKGRTSNRIKWRPAGYQFDPRERHADQQPDQET